MTLENKTNNLITLVGIKGSLQAAFRHIPYVVTEGGDELIVDGTELDGLTSIEALATMHKKAVAYNESKHLKKMHKK